MMGTGTGVHVCLSVWLSCFCYYCSVLRKEQQQKQTLLLHRIRSLTGVRRQQPTYQIAAGFALLLALSVLSLAEQCLTNLNRSCTCTVLSFVPPYKLVHYEFCSDDMRRDETPFFRKRS